jgi:hypothetical protein
LFRCQSTYFKDKTNLYIYTIIDLLCENRFLRAISHWRQSLWCKMAWEVSFKQSKEMVVLIIGDLARWRHYNVTLENSDIALIIGVLMGKDQKENVQIIHQKLCSSWVICIPSSVIWLLCFHAWLTWFIVIYCGVLWWEYCITFDTR